VIWFLRHGEAADGDEDFSRPLTKKGERQSIAAGEALASLGIAIDACLTSPRVRALDTALLACQTLGIEPEVVEGLSGGRFDAEEVAMGRGEVLLVGHEPDFSQAIHDLTGARTEMKKGSLAAVDGHVLVSLLRPAQINKLS